MPLVKTRGAYSSRAYGEFAQAVVANYIEDVFSTWLYAGNSVGSTSQTITTGINLSANGGMVWIKSRSAASHNLFDTARGVKNFVESNTTQVAQTYTNGGVTAFSTTGFTMGPDFNTGNNSGENYASWTFRKQAKFFDVVTYTGTGANRTIAHSLGSVPGCIIIKRRDTIADWQVYHRSLANTEYMVLNTTAAKATSATLWNSTTPTASVFSVGTDATVNASGGTYVAYLFAHDAGGFGAAGTDNVISCGSYTGNGSATGPVVTLGYEPQWVMIKNASSTGSWQILDNMRGMPVGSADATLQANASSAESSVEYLSPTATGFQITSTSTEVNTNTGTYIYMAIRRGPMKTPTSGTSVFGLSARTGTGATATVTGGQVADALLVKNRGAAVGDLFAARLTGTGYLETSSTAAEVAAGATILQANPWDVMDGTKLGTTSTITNASANTFINYMFRRAPGFFDVVCYTGTGAQQNVSHNLGVTPEFVVVKSRSAASGANGWPTFSSSADQIMWLNLNLSRQTFFSCFPVAPTSSVFTVGNNADTGTNAVTYVAYLFATIAGVSKVGSYTGTGTAQTIDCGFTGGARFVLIKRTDSTGDWYVWDTARGIIAGNDPYLLLNSTAAEVTNTDYLSVQSSGFGLTATAPAALNANGGSYLFLAIA